MITRDGGRSVRVAGGAQATPRIGNSVSHVLGTRQRRRQQRVRACAADRAHCGAARSCGGRVDAPFASAVTGEQQRCADAARLVSRDPAHGGPRQWRARSAAVAPLGLPDTHGCVAGVERVSQRPHHLPVAGRLAITLPRRHGRAPPDLVVHPPRVVAAATQPHGSSYVDPPRALTVADERGVLTGRFVRASWVCDGGPPSASPGARSKPARPAPDHPRPAPPGAVGLDDTDDSLALDQQRQQRRRAGHCRRSGRGHCRLGGDAAALRQQQRPPITATGGPPKRRPVWLMYILRGPRDFRLRAPPPPSPRPWPWRPRLCGSSAVCCALWNP